MNITILLAALTIHAYPGDPGDSLYSAARAALSDGHFVQAAQMFERVAQDYPKSGYVPSALYYEAFAYYRAGSHDNLQRARGLLTALVTQFPSPSRRGDADALRVRVCGGLARMGDRSCEHEVSQVATKDPDPEPRSGGETPCAVAEDDDNDTRIAALNALMQVNTDQALPILRRVLQRRDQCSVELRRKALFIVSQKDSPDAVDIMLASAREDPSSEVRQQAVFWLSQVNDPRAMVMLDSLLHSPSADRELREKALFAISQHEGAGANKSLRDFASSPSEDPELRGKAYFWLGQSNDASNEAWLKTQFTHEKNGELKEKIMTSLAERGHGDSGPWLVDVAADSSEPSEVRKKAVFWAGQGGAGAQKLMGLYDRTTDGEIRNEVLFALAETRDPAAIDALMRVAKSDHSVEQRKKAIFWLSQSHDPRVAPFLASLVEQ